MNIQNHYELINNINMKSKETVEGKLNRRTKLNIEDLQKKSKNNKDIGNIITLKASVGGYTGSSYNVLIDFIKKKAIYTSFGYGFSNKETKEISLKEDDIKEFMYKLNEMNIGVWKKKYISKKVIMDGTGWQVNLVTDKGNFESVGSNSYPKCWKDFCRSIKTLIKQDFR